MLDEYLKAVQLQLYFAVHSPFRDDVFLAYRRYFRRFARRTKLKMRLRRFVIYERAAHYRKSLLILSEGADILR